MPRLQEAMKDVGGCDKPRGAANQALIRGFLNGETHAGESRRIRRRIHNLRRQTRGSETSQYPEEEKTNQ
jgi:hypothetical protein